MHPMNAITDEARQRFIDVGAEATDEEIDRLSSAIHIGLTVIGMIDSIGETKKVMEKMGVDPNDGHLASSTILGHKPTGNLFQITVTTSNEEEAEAHAAMLASATDLDEAAGMTKH
jgi:hypothetical protein